MGIAEVHRGRRDEATATIVGPVKGHGDFRKILDDRDVDAVVVSTPDHWLALMTMMACAAGKDVYVEKPMSHVVSEGRPCIEAARKYGRMLQHGTQQRSDPRRAGEIAAVQSGRYGKLLVSKGYCCKPRWSIGHKEFTTPPADLDFNLWLGPAAEQPYHGNLVHYNCTGSGISATATSAIRESMRWT